jgi:glycosyltransferase involved in cell wall biosynthesis
MESTPQISVVITCYNYGQYLRNCLESVLAQTYQNIEIVVVDDGSTDDTPEIMARYRDLPRIVCIRQENGGQARAKNTGIKNATGDFIAFLDADDAWEKDKIERQIACFAKPEVGVVYCRARYIDENTDEFNYEMTGHYLQPRRGKVTEWLIFDNFVQFSSSVVRKECFDRFGTFDETLKMGIDWDLWLRISTAYEFDYVDDRLFYYRMGHSGQMSKNAEERQRCSDRIMSNFLSRYPNIVSTYSIDKAKSLTYCNRGEYYRKINRWRSTCYFLKALKMDLVDMNAHAGLIKNILCW